MATYSANFSSGWARLNVDVSTQSYSIADNTSYLKCVLSITKLTSCSSWNQGGANMYMTINGTTLFSTATIDIRSLGVGSTQTVSTQYITVAHNSDGTKSVSVKGYCASGVGLGTANVSGTFICTSIPRQATISTAPNFTDIDNPSITYSNPAGNTVSTLQACISLTGSKDDIAYRDISKTGTTYTFNLTESERNILRNATTTANTRTVIFIVRTVLGGNTYYSTLSKTLTITNANPTITATAYDTNSTTLALTGNNQTIIKGYNSVYVSMTSQAYKGASIVNGYITNNGKIYDIQSGTIHNIENPTISFFTQDSRGNTLTKDITLTIVDYIKLTCDLDVKAPTADGRMSFTIKGNYFNASFGAASNTLALAYRIKENDGSYGAWTTASTTISKSNNTYSQSIDISGLNYRSSYTVQARAIDKLNTIYSVEVKVKTTPIFDWGEEDFNFNVPVNINGDLNITGSLSYGGGGSGSSTNIVDLVYPVGSIYMSVNSTNPASLFGGSWGAWGSGRVPVGVNTSDSNFNSVEKTGGASTHTLTTAQMPSHTHTQNAHSHGVRYKDFAGLTATSGGWIVLRRNESGDGYDGTDGDGAISTTATNQNTGGGGAHNNLQPYITCYMWKRTA